MISFLLLLFNSHPTFYCPASVKEDNRLQEIKDRIRSLYVLCFIFRYSLGQEIC